MSLSMLKALRSPAAKTAIHLYLTWCNQTSFIVLHKEKSQGLVCQDVYLGRQRPDWREPAKLESQLKGSG